MSDIEVDAPTVTNDSGTGRDGTRADETWYDALLAAINVQVLSSTNPSLTPADAIDEVVTARGSLGALDDRLDVSINEDGTLKSTATSTFITETQLMGGLGGVNLVRNDDFMVWPAGDSAAPLYWDLTGAAATIARTGTGLGDTSRKVGDFAAKVTRNGTNATLTNTLLSGTAFTRADFLKQQYIGFGVWVKCSTPNIARVSVADNTGTTYSSYHTGGGSWEFLAVTRQIDSSGTAIIVGGVVDTSDGNAIFSGATALLLQDDLDVVQYQPSPVMYGAINFSLSGNLGAGVNQGRFVMARGGIVKDVQCLLKTAPVGADVIFDVNTWDGGAYTSMFSSGARPTVADGATRAGTQPDDTYARRCVRGGFGTSISAGAELTLDVDQVGSGTTGADAVIEIRTLQYASPLERFLEHDD